MALLVTQKDRLFELVENHRAFTPFQFSVQEYPSSGNVEFHFYGSDYYFIIKPITGISGSYIINYSPGKISLSESAINIEINPYIYNYFEDWLDNIEREISAPNKWEKLIMDIESFGVPNNPGYNADKFTFQEYTEVTNNILQLKEGIKEIGLTPEQYNIINEKLDFLIEQGKSLKKFDWRSLFIGTIINIATNIIINQNSIQAFYELVKGFFSKLLM